MPYIKKERRLDFIDLMEPETTGELNYCFSTLCIDYLVLKGKSYSTLNDIIGALECAKLEITRRLIVPYEDKKIEENGDVFH